LINDENIKLCITKFKSHKIIFLEENLKFMPLINNQKGTTAIGGKKGPFVDDYCS
jgi:hypothetical protein